MSSSYSCSPWRCFSQTKNQRELYSTKRASGAAWCPGSCRQQRVQTAVFDVKTVPCGGGAIGLEFADSYGDPEAFAYFLSVGGGPSGREGEGYKKTPELVKEAMGKQPNVIAPHAYRVFKPLGEVDPAQETPRVVVFLANPDQISALTVLANYGRPTNDNVILHFVAGCGSFCLLPDRLNQQEPLRAVLGMTDISARPYVPRRRALLHRALADVPGDGSQRQGQLL